jgi:hypothetical protein
VLQGKLFTFQYTTNLLTLDYSAQRSDTSLVTALRLVDTEVVDTVVNKAATVVDSADVAAVVLVDRPATPAVVTDTCLVSSHPFHPLRVSANMSR